MSAISKALGPLPQQFSWLENLVAPAAAPAFVQLCQPNPLRWGLLIGCPVDSTTGNSINSFISLRSNPAINNNGLPLTTAMPFFGINFRDYGILVQQAWWGSSATVANANDWCVIEVLIQQ